MADIFTALRADHARIEQVFVGLEESRSVLTGATPEELAHRRAAVEQLVMAESRHEAAEEQYFWPAVRERVPGGADLVAEGIQQESEGKQILHELDRTPPDDEKFETLLSEFIAAGREHITFEQQEVWPRLLSVLPAEEREKLGARFERARMMGPTRPHPRTPPKPGVLKSVGVAAAVMDRARDFFTNRGDPRP